MKKIAILGSADALKPLIVIENIIETNLIINRKIVFFTEKKAGKCVDYCKKMGIEIFVFPNTKLDNDESFQKAKHADAEILVSVGWPYKIPSLFLGLFQTAAINCHGSILPDYRGSRAYMHYWANCEEYYGATIHYMNDNFDDGNIIIQGRIKSFSEETPSIIHRRSAELCAFLLPTAILLVESGYPGYQIDGQKRYFLKISSEDFEKYRRYNENTGTSERKLTPHKILDIPISTSNSDNL